ncbi:hypothetical protein AYI69_g3266 [Smittium culicis]|uniref:Uncharacterized protein n=1 Tax=Smittium culicis TaxID=133412 RepID=A0A1R1YK70_9FUNG|nr:hypothetical protein AYI69_g3266 [Smittium culicis]
MGINELCKGLIDSEWDHSARVGALDAPGETINKVLDCDNYPECDRSVLWSDITDALRDTPNNKAPGADGVPSEVWKLVMAEPSPTTPLAKLIQKIINIMYGTWDIPQCLGTSIVVPVPKKGDLKDPDNY